MVTKKQTLIAGALLLGTCFRIDAILFFADCQDIYLDISCALLMLVSATAFLWALSTRRQWLWELVKTLWKSELLCAMVTLSIIMDFLPDVLPTECLARYLSYVSWALSDIILLAALFLSCKSDDGNLNIV